MTHESPALLEKLRSLGEAEAQRVQLAHRTLRLSRFGLAMAFFGLVVASTVFLQTAYSWNGAILMSAAGVFGYILGRFDRVLLEKLRQQAALQHWTDWFR